VTLEITIPTRPARPYQRKFWRYMEGGGKNAFLVWPRRHGKDEAAMAWTAADAMQHPGNYWHCLPEYEQARKALWDGIDAKTGMRRPDQIFPPEIVTRRRDKDMMLELTSGSTWQLIGSDRYNQLVGAGPRGLVMSEYALSHPAAWAYFRPMLLDSGGWAIFNTTPRGRNHAYKLFHEHQDDPEWFCERLTANQCGVFTEQELERERREYQLELGVDDGDAKFRQEYLCDWNAAIVGAYYAREMAAAENEGRICDVAYDPGLPVYTGWDLGRHDSTTIWFVQRCGGQIRVIDCETATGVGLDAYAKLLKDKPYVYATHYWPHDGAQGDVGIIGGRTRVEVMRGLGVTPIEVLDRELDGIADGIQAVRRILPRCFFDRTRCKLGIDALIQYQRKWDDNAKTFANTPMRNWATHFADGFRTLAMGLPTQFIPAPAQGESDPRYKSRGRGSRRGGSSSRWAF